MSSKYSYSINISGKIDNLDQIKKQLAAQTFKIDIKLTNDSRKFINELKELVAGLNYAFSHLGKGKGFPSAVNPQTGLSGLETAQRNKSQQTLIAQLQSKVNMSNRMNLGAYNNVKVGSETYSGSNVVQTYNDLLARAQALNITSNDYKTKLTEIQTEVQKISPAYEAVQKAAQKTKDKNDNFFTDLSKKVKNFVAYRTISFIFNTIQNGIKSAINLTIDLNSQMRDINKVLDLTEKQQTQLIKSANELANSYARTTQEVLKAMEYFAKAGFGLSQVEALAELSIKLQNVGDMASETASKFLIAANAAFQFNGSAEKLSKTIDVVNNLSNNAAYTVDQLAEAIKVAGAVAYSAGLSMEEFAAMVTTVGEATQRSGREVGNGVKTILLRLTQVNDTSADAEESISNADKALSAVGINVRDTASSFRPAMEILTELAKRWETLSDVQQRAITYNLAGVYRSNILEAFLANIEDYENNLYIALNSIGSATKENELYMNSLEAAFKKVTAAWEGFVASLSEDGAWLSLGSMIKGILNLVAILIKNLNVGMITFSILSTSFVVITKWATIVKIFKSIGAAIMTMHNGGRLLTGTILAVDAAQKKAAISAKGWMAIITLATMAIMYLVDASKKAKEAQDEAIRATSENAELLIGQFGQMNILIKRYQSLHEQYIKTGEGVEELKDLQSELNATYKEQAAGIDLVNGKQEESLKLLNLLREAKLKEALTENRSAYNQAQEKMGKTASGAGLYNGGLWTGIGSKESKFISAYRQLSVAGADISSYKIPTGSSINAYIESLTVGEYEKFLNNFAEGLNSELEKLPKDIKSRTKDEKYTAKELEKSLSFISNLQKEARDALQDSKDAIARALPFARDAANAMISGDLANLQGYEMGLYNLLGANFKPENLSDEGIAKFSQELQKLAKELNGIDPTNFDKKWESLIGLGVPEDKKEIAREYLTNTQAQLSDTISATSEALSPLTKTVSELERIYKATEKIFDLRRQIAEQDGLTGDDYSNFVGSGTGNISNPKIAKIAKEAQDDYIKYLEDIKKSQADGLNNEETITALYEEQNKLRSKKLEIIKKELDIEERRKKLNSLENERTQVSFINGQRVYTADHQAIAEQRDEIAQEETELAKLVSQLETMNILLSGSTDGTFTGREGILSYNDSIKELENALKSGTEGSLEALEKFKDNIGEVSSLLIGEKGLKGSLTNLFSVMDKYIKETKLDSVETRVRRDNIFNFAKVEISGIDDLDGFAEEIKRRGTISLIE